MPFPSVEELVEIANRTTSSSTPQASPAADAETIRAMQALARGVPIADHIATTAARVLKPSHPKGPASQARVHDFVR